MGSKQNAFLIDNPWTLHAALYADLHFVLSTLNDQMKNRPKSILGNHLQVIDYYVQDVLELAQPFVGSGNSLLSVLGMSTSVYVNMIYVGLIEVERCSNVCTRRQLQAKEISREVTIAQD